MMNSLQAPSTPPGDGDATVSGPDFPLVGIGASAGGLLALARFFENMPSSNGMGFIVILPRPALHNVAEPHTDQTDAQVDKAVQRATPMPVTRITTDTCIEQNHVYIATSNCQVTTHDGQLCVSASDRAAGPSIVIDNFFRALAISHGERAIAIVLSGTGTDGATGIATIKERGGITIAQLPADSEHQTMPRAAIDTGIVDFILPVVEMPRKLVELWRNARRMAIPLLSGDDELPAGSSTSQAAAAAEVALQRVISLLCTHTGQDFGHYKRATLLRRIERRMQINSALSLPDYATLLEQHPDEYERLRKELLIGVTSFFRNAEAFDSLEHEILPRLFDNRPPEDEVRAWVPACSTGEEAYSIAMLLAEQAARQSQSPPIQVFASDIDEQAIGVARKGIYSSTAIGEVPAARFNKFFTRLDGGYQIRTHIRDKVLFATHNLLRDPPFSRVDLISCRNLLIYLNRNTQAQLLEMFHFALKPGGILFLGNSESADALTEYFVPIDKKHRLYSARLLERTTHFMPRIQSRANRQTLRAVTADRQPTSYADIHQRGLMLFGPVSILVDMDLNILHMSDHASSFLRFTGGEPSRNLLALILPDLRIELRNALHQAQRTGVGTEKRRVSTMRDKHFHTVTINVHRFRDNDLGADLIIVQLDETPRVYVEAMAANLQGDAVLQQIEEELQRNKEQLQESIRHSEISTSELRATNEELQAINEELRSATEELETSKEELQSANEELVTVNDELQARVRETGKTNDDLRNLIASSDIATIFVDRNMHLKRFTPRATELFSMVPSDVGRSLLDITHVLDYDDIASDIAATFEHLQPIEREVQRHDGNHYIVRLLPYRTAEDKIDGAVITFLDVTPLHLAEERARLGEQHMRLVAESTRDFAIITLDTKGVVTSWNTGAERIFGYTEAEIIGQSGAIIFVPEDRAAGVPEDEMRRAREDGRAEDERWHLKKDGHRFYCSGVMTPIRDSRFHGYAKIARDQTQRVQEESKRAAALNHEQIERWNAETSSALKDEFLAIMSHELRHPLNMIHINIELLSRMPGVRDSPVSKKAASVIRNSVLSQAKIIEDLLDMSRLNTGKLTLTTTAVDIAALVNSTADVAREDPAARDLTLVTEGTDEALMVEADPVRLEQIVLNLLSNAIKFTPGRGTVRLRLRRDEMEARLDVIDNGQGISSDVLPYIFDMFGQAGSVTNRSKKGLGIGLALVQQLAELHHGRIEATSEGSGKGACFSVWLPLAEAYSSRAQENADALSASIDGLNILMVDDAEDMVLAFKYLLEMDGAKVFVATGARDGLEILKREKIDLLISDISMPDVNGYEFIERIRRAPLNMSIPAIAVSGLGREQDRAQSIRSGFSAHINKPISLEQLTGTILELTSQQRDASTLETAPHDD